MENLSLIAAIGKNNELGLDNHLIWKIKEDLSFYRSMTIYKNIIMGRKTFESMPSKALEKRKIHVLSSRALDRNYDIDSFSNIEDLLKFIEITGKEFIVVGGAQIYEALLPYVDTMYLTEIDDYANADTFFPIIDTSDWDIETIYYHEANKKNNEDVSYSRNKYVRKRVK